MADITVDSIVLYATCCSLLIYIYIFICNFASHFKFNRCKCPWIVRDEKVSAIYPTLLTFHILTTLIISSLIIYSTWDNSYHSTQSISCYMRFRIFSTNALYSVWMANGPHFHRFAPDLITAWAIYIVLLLETYFVYSRYYGCIYYVIKECVVPSQWRIFLPFTIYIISLFILFWFSITMIPILALFISIVHILTSAYYNYYFYISIKLSYEQIFATQTSGAIHNQMVQQLNSIRFICRISFLSALISAFTICAFIACNSLFRIVPLCLCCSSFCLFLVFNNNKVLLKSTIFCQCKTVHHLLCIAPFEIVQRRRSTLRSRNNRNNRNTSTTLKRAKTDHKTSAVATPSVETSSEKETDDVDRKVKKLKKKTQKRVRFGADVLMDIIGSEEEIVPPEKPAPLQIRPSSSNQNPEYLKVVTPKTDVRKTRSEPAEATFSKKKKSAMRATRSDNNSGEFSYTTLETIREWMAPSSFSKLSEEVDSVKSINSFLNAYGFTKRAPDLFKMDDIERPAAIEEEETDCDI